MTSQDMPPKPRLTRFFGVFTCTLLTIASSTEAIAGYIGSNGTTGRSLHVRPRSSFEGGGVGTYDWSPPIPSPQQDSIILTPEDFLIVAIPSMGKTPAMSMDTVTYEIAGSEITVHARQEWYGAVSATVYGPNDYLLGIGQLPVGEYRLTLETTHVESYLDRTRTKVLPTGYTTFRVVNVPEPAGVIPMGLASLLLLRGRRTGSALSRNRWAISRDNAEVTKAA